MAKKAYTTPSELAERYAQWDDKIETLRNHTVVILGAKLVELSWGDTLLFTVDGTYGENNTNDTSVIMTTGQALINQFRLWLEKEMEGDTIFPIHATINMQKGANHPYWFLFDPE